MPSPLKAVGCASVPVRYSYFVRSNALDKRNEADTLDNLITITASVVIVMDEA